jgi:hypothetical protein
MGIATSYVTQKDAIGTVSTAPGVVRCRCMHLAHARECDLTFVTRAQTLPNFQHTRNRVTT